MLLYFALIITAIFALDDVDASDGGWSDNCEVEFDVYMDCYLQHFMDDDFTTLCATEISDRSACECAMDTTYDWCDACGDECMAYTACEYVVGDDCSFEEQQWEDCVSMTCPTTTETPGEYACVDGTFSIDGSGLNPCDTCHACPPNSEVLSECTATSDTECEGAFDCYYYSHEGRFNGNPTHMSVDTIQECEQACNGCVAFVWETGAQPGDYFTCQVYTEIGDPYDYTDEEAYVKIDSCTYTPSDGSDASAFTLVLAVLYVVQILAW